LENAEGDLRRAVRPTFGQSEIAISMTAYLTELFDGVMHEYENRGVARTNCNSWSGQIVPTVHVGAALMQLYSSVPGGLLVQVPGVAVNPLLHVEGAETIVWLKGRAQ